ncbi:MAG: peptidylprolyl isomerase [Bacteroidales bacterium]|nr:peptidylprolyl isomerase [Bacteroidales bacterium]
MMKTILRITAVVAALTASFSVFAQTYPKGLIDKTVAVVGNEVITIGELEEQLRMMRIEKGVYASDNIMRCELLERLMEQNIFLMQARIDSLSINQDNVTSQLNSRIDQIRTSLGGDEEVENYFGKPLYKLRQDWKRTFENQSLIQQKQAEVAQDVPELTPYDVKQYVEKTDSADLPMVPIRYQLSQICIYPDREAASIAVKEKLLGLRERIINGEKFSTLARIYSEDPGSARKGGELGMASKSIFWPAFSDAAMSLRPGVISQIVETPDGFHLIEIIEKKGDMFNARHILIKPQYTVEDQQKAFKTLDSLRTEINNEAVSFQLAARFYSQDPATRTNGGQMADPYTGSSYFQIDELKPQDYRAIKDLKEGEISEPVESLDNEGRGNTVYKIIRVDKVIPAHTATFESDYNQLIDGVKNQKAMDAINAFLDKKIKTSKIYIDPIFSGCEFSRAAWNEAAEKSR